MPELAEVAYYARQWEPIVGQSIEKVWVDNGSRVFRDNKTLRPKTLVGAALDTIHKHGKQMLLQCSAGQWVHLHLGMTGKMRSISRQESGGADIRAPHDRLVLHSPEWTAVFNDMRHFGRVTFLQSPSLPDFWRKLPPAIDSPDFHLNQTKHALERRSSTAIKSLLLDQAHFPGIGNWMADEILWRARIHPGEASGSLSEAQTTALHREIKAVTADALAVIAPDWGQPPDHWLFNHRWKDGGICPVSGTPLVRGKINGRTACWSPALQGTAPQHPVGRRNRQPRRR